MAAAEAAGFDAVAFFFTTGVGVLDDGAGAPAPVFGAVVLGVDVFGVLVVVVDAAFDAGVLVLTPEMAFFAGAGAGAEADGVVFLAGVLLAVVVKVLDGVLVICLGAE